MSRTLGTCSVCFAVHVLTSGKGTKTQRHGFTVVGAGRGHGHMGAWHTGPCFGTGYSHLGLSCEGTRHALDIAIGRRDSLIKAGEILATRPVLSWTQEISEGYGSSRTVRHVQHDVRPGGKSDHAIGRPDYEALLASRIAHNDVERAAVERAIKTYRKVIAEWAPGKWPTVTGDGAAKPAQVVHLAAGWGRARGKSESTLVVGACSAWAMQAPFGQATTKDRAKVTCARCKKSMESGAKEAAKRAAILSYRVELPDGQVETTTNERAGTKRPLLAAVIARRTWLGQGAESEQHRWYVEAWCVSEATTKARVKDAKKWAAEVRVVALEPVS
jgi:hypothetical protein